MLPGPTLILKLPHCNHLVQYPTIQSGNTTGAQQWSDGKMEAPMMPEQLQLCKCPTDGKLFWVQDTEVVAEWEFYKDDEIHTEWEQLDKVAEPCEEDYWTAIGTELSNTPELLSYIRMKLWWTGNDHIRRGRSKELSAEHLANLTEFEKLLSSDDDDTCIMFRAEALRELSRFDESLALLKKIISGKNAEFARIIQDLAEQHYAIVVDMARPTAHLTNGAGGSSSEMEEECILELQKKIEEKRALVMQKYTKRSKR